MLLAERKKELAVYFRCTQIIEKSWSISSTSWSTSGRGVVLLRRGRTCCRGPGPRPGGHDTRGQRPQGRCRYQAEGHGYTARQAQANQGGRLRQVPDQQGRLLGLPDGARLWLADRKRRHRGDVSISGGRPHGHHRRQMERRRGRSRPQATSCSGQRRLRRVLAVPSRQGTKPRAQDSLRRRGDPDGRMTSLQGSRTRTIWCARCRVRRSGDVVRAEPRWLIEWLSEPTLST